MHFVGFFFFIIACFTLFDSEISSYGYETEAVTFRQEHKLQVYENKVISEKG
jgi:hypothetical protein